MNLPSPRFQPNYTPCNRTRREFLWQVGGGFAGLALIDLLSRDGFFARHGLAAEAAAGAVGNANGGAQSAPYLLDPKPSHFPAKAKHAVFLFMNGAPSHVDTFDPKPELDKHDGEPYRGDAAIGSNGRPIGHLMKSPFAFSNHGQSGLPISDVFPHTRPK